MNNNSILCVPGLIVSFALTSSAARAEEASAVRREKLLHSYGTYACGARTPEGTIDIPRLLDELVEIHANTNNFLIARAATDWDDLKKFLPLAKAKGIRVWVTVLPPSESKPGHYSEPFRMDYVKWASELSALSAREPALVGWSIDDFVHNQKFYTHELMKQMIDAMREKNPRFAFVPCVYYRQATPAFVKDYREFLDGILFPYRSESTTAGLKDATQVEKEVATLKERFGRDFPIIVDIYATAHSRLGASTPEYVEQLMKLSYPVADGVHIYCHQNKREPKQREKYDIVQRVMSGWDQKASAPVR